MGRAASRPTSPRSTSRWGCAARTSGPDNLCIAYEQRPEVCRSYAADELCKLIAAPTLEERVQKYLAHFELTAEAKAVKDRGLTSLRSVRAPHADPLPAAQGEAD